MKRIHEKEMIRFAKSPDRTRIWWRTIESRDWSTSYIPSWAKGYVYIVDDEWAEIRKGDADGIIIQFRNQSTGNWQATIEEIIDYDEDDVAIYRLKPAEPVYEYQWIYRIEKNKYDISRSYYKTKEDFEKYTMIQSKKIIERYEPSKRLVK